MSVSSNSHFYDVKHVIFSMSVVFSVFHRLLPEVYTFLFICSNESSSRPVEIRRVL